MKLRSILHALLFFLFTLYPVFARQADLKKEELENFVILTDQDFYLAGDRIWFAARLLKNHETYRYSKLAYLAVLDASGKQIHQEKMLLTGQNMIFGDFFVPESISSGVFSLVIYTRWMSNFADFPISRKQFLVVNPSAPQSVGEPALFWERTPYASAPISILHTSDRAEVIEIQDPDGNTLEILESVEPFQKTLSTVKPANGYRLVFRNKEFDIEPEAWHWDPADFSLNSRSETKPTDLRIFTHSDWMILEELAISGTKLPLSKKNYQKLSSFQISALNASNEVVWSYQVQLPAKSSGQMELGSKGKVGEELKLALIGFPSQLSNGIVMATMEEDPKIHDFAEILNHPNWKNLSGKVRTPNLISALNQPIAGPLIQKDYSPMFDYKVWSTDIYSRFESSSRAAGFSFSIPDSLIEAKIDRRVYQDHFEITHEVVRLQSPFAADKVYLLDDYNEFSDLESFLKEIVPQVRLRKSKSGLGKDIFVANTDNEHVKFNKKPVVLVDFHRPLTAESIWNIDMTTLDRIEIYYHRSTLEATNLGEASGDGLIVLYTKNNEYFLKNNLPKENYLLADVSVPRLPDYWQRNSGSVSAHPLQFMDVGFSFDRGKSRTGKLIFDTAGNWLVDAWVFGNDEFERIRKRVQISP